jgi:O-acetylserine/cysteine efflux transporter
MTAQPQHKFGGYDVLVAIAMNVMWGLNLIAVKVGVDLVQPLTAAWLRQVMVLLICLPALRLIEGRMRELVVLGLLSGALFYIIVNISMAVSTNVSALAIAGQLGAPFSLILAVIFLGERVHKYRIAGMALAFVGVVLVVFDPHAIDEHQRLRTISAAQKRARLPAKPAAGRNGNAGHALQRIADGCALQLIEPFAVDNINRLSGF